MTAQTKPNLKGYFNTGDVPTEAQFANLIDTIGLPTLMVAATNASTASKGRADYICDGSGDEVQIHAAIAALPSGVRGQVLLSEGTFDVANTVVNDNDLVTLRGMGRWSTIIRPQISTDPDPVVLFGSTATLNRCNLYDLLIHGREDSDPGHTGDGLHFHVNSGIIRGVDVIWTGADGIYLNGVSAGQSFELIMDSCKIYQPGNDGLVVGVLCFDAMFNKVFVYGGAQEGTPFGRYGILYQGEACIFRDCHSYYNQSYGFATDNNSDSVFIEGGAYETNDTTGMLLWGIDRGYVRGVWFYGNTTNDLYIQASSELMVTNNLFTSACGGSFVLYQATECIVSDNILKNATVRAIFLDEVSDGNIVSWNICAPNIGSSQNAILIDDSDNNWILDNLCNDSIDTTGTSTGNITRTPA